jgi:hypothetical protein
MACAGQISVKRRLLLKCRVWFLSGISQFRANFFLLAGLVLATLSTSAEAASLIWKTETAFLSEKRTSDECRLDDGECLSADHVSYVYKSHYGGTVYLTYEEAFRAILSFDKSLDLDADRGAQFVFQIRQLAPGAYDWGGVLENGTFRPLYVIKRFYDLGFDYSTDEPDTSKSGLIVWSLSRGTQGESSAHTIGTAISNAQARRLAEQDFRTKHTE